MKPDQTIALLAVFISLISLFVSWLSIRNTNQQFEIINQSYLQAEITSNGLTIPNNISNTQMTEFSDSILVEGLNCIADLTNTGNIPLKYNVMEYNVYFNGILKNNLDTTANNEGILYPKQLLTYFVKTIPFQDSGVPVKFGIVKEIEITVSVIIEYNDLNSSHKKYIKRKLKFILHNGVVESRYISFDDKI